ncbi:MAG TPA: hypothetical protein VIR27_10980 [Mycobacteriales bacterium]|jgi:hypothetical protein
MFDSVQAGWLAGDDYRAAVEAAGVVELPHPGDNDPQDEEVEPQGLPADLLGGRFEDPRPPGISE